MVSTKTVTALINEVYGESFARAFDEIDLITSIADELPVTLEDMVEKYLDKVIDPTISEIELVEESIAIDFETSQSRVSISAKGKWILIVVITIATLVLGAQPVIEIMKAIFSH